MSPPRLYWVDAPAIGRLAVVSRPRAVSDFAALKAAGVDTLVSLLAIEEAQAVGLGRAPQQCADAGLDFISLPIVDHGVPSSVEAVDAVVDTLSHHLSQGRGIAAHCYAGLGRSPLMIGAVLVRHGLAPAYATSLLSDARGTAVPEMTSQHRWLEAYESWLRR